MDIFKAPSVPETVSSAVSIDLFQLPEAPPVPEEVSSAASVDFFQLPEAPAPLSVDLFQPSVVPSTSSTNVFQPLQTLMTSPDFFAVTGQQQSTATSNENLPQFPVPKDEGWATFNTPQFSAPVTSNEKIKPGFIPSESGGSLGNVDLFSSLDTSMQWPPFQDSGFHIPSSKVPSAWNDNLQGVTAPNSTSTQVSATVKLSFVFMGLRDKEFL